MNKVLFDSSALLAIIHEEIGFEEIVQMLPYSSMSIVNVAEVITSLAENNIPKNEIDALIKELIPEIIDFDYDIASLLGNLIKDTQNYGLSFSDRCCIATGIKLNRKIYTTNKAWAKIEESKEYNIKLIEK